MGAGSCNGESIEWAMETDVLVIGYGYAGGFSAISASDAGADVMIIEKQDKFGGISITSGGGFCVSSDPEATFRYLKATCAGRTPDDVLRAMAQGMYDAPTWLRELAHKVGARVSESDRSGATYPFQGRDSIYAIKIDTIEGFNGYPWAQGLRGGARLMKVIDDNVRLRKIRVLYSMAAKRLLTNAKGRVIGVRAQAGEKGVAIKARRGVILACGGFEHDPQMISNYLEGQPVYSMAPLCNTGDGIRMAQAVGANLWHMWHFHGSYGFKYAEFPIAFRHRFRGTRLVGAKSVRLDLRDGRPVKETGVMPWIVVDQYGKRFMNEYHPAPQDTGWRPLFYYDPERQEFPRNPCYLVFDDAGRQMGQVGEPIATEPNLFYEWSQDNMREVEKGWILRADTLEDLAARANAGGRAKIDPAILVETVGRWNSICRNGVDPDYHRPGETMHALEKPPFYIMEAWPIITNTQGGPERDAKQRVLNAFGEPIPGLYAVGELGSIFGHLYLEGGNVAECVVGGKIAGIVAASEPILQEAEVA